MTNKLFFYLIIWALSFPACSEDSLLSLVQKSCPFSIFQSTNSSFNRRLSKEGKVDREYKPPICTTEGTWLVDKDQLKLREKIRCLKDPDDHDKGYDTAWWQKSSFKIINKDGQLELNGILKDSNDTFLMN